MNRIQHLFYFYSQYWQLMLTLLAAATLDYLQTRGLLASLRQRFSLIMAVLAAMGALIFLVLSLVTQNFVNSDVNLEGNLLFALLLMLASGILLQFLRTRSRRRQQFFVVLLLTVAVVDLSKYFWIVSGVDERHTFTRWAGLTDPLPSIVVEPFSSPWPLPDMQQGFTGNLLSFMPVRNDFWDQNNYLWHRFYFDLHHAVGIEGYYFDREPSLKNFALGRDALTFYPRAEPLPNYDEMVAAYDKNHDLYQSRLFIHNKPDVA